MRTLAVMAVTCLTLSAASAQTRARPPLRGHKMRIKIDSTPQQAAVYVDSKDFGIEGYTPTTLKLPKGDYTIIIELPGFRPVSRPIHVTRSEGFVFTMERAARPAVVDVRSVSNDSATGGALFVDGAQLGTVPGHVEVAPGSHLIEVKKAGFKDYREQTSVQEGETRSLVIDLSAEAKKGSILVTADVTGADVYVDGVRRDAAPALIGDLIEGSHVIEVRKDPLPPFKTTVQVIGNQQTKVEARIQAQVPQVGSVRVVCGTPNAQVVVDGEMKGPANTEIGGLKPGQHIIEVRAQGFQSQVVEVQVVPGEQRIARIDLKEAASAQNSRLRVVTPVPDAEVFIDGSSVGKAPVDRNDLAAGKHYVTVRAKGYAEWKREVNLEGGGATTLTAELSASGVLKVISNVTGADVLIDGAVVGSTPLTLNNITAGDHLVQVRKTGYVDARQSFHIDGGEQKILSADLAEVRVGPSVGQLQSVYRSMSSFSAVTVEPAKFTLDLAGGFFPFVELRLTVGAFRKRVLGLDAGIDVRTNILLTEGSAHAKLQFVKAGPVAVGTDLAIGGGGGPAGRNSFHLDFGIILTLMFGDLVRFTLHPYGEVFTDGNCSLKAGATSGCQSADDPGNSLDRQTGFRLMLQGVLEVSVHQVANIFFIFEGDPITQRQMFDGAHSFLGGTKLFPWAQDPQVYGRMGVTFKF